MNKLILVFIIFSQALYASEVMTVDGESFTVDLARLSCRPLDNKGVVFNSICIRALEAAQEEDSKRAECNFQLIINHNEMVSPYLKSSVGQNALGQACFLKGLAGSNMEGFSLRQEGSNGDWMQKWDEGRKYNAGLTPYFSKDSAKEREVYARHLSESGLNPNGELFKILVYAVGYIRMTTYHWMTLLKRSAEAPRSCRRNGINVTMLCQNDEFKSAYKRRVRLVEGINSLNTPLLTEDFKKKLKDARGRRLFGHNIMCGKDVNGLPIYAYPRQCEDQFTINQDVLDEISKGPCKRLYDQAANPAFSEIIFGESAEEKLIFAPDLN